MRKLNCKNNLHDKRFTWNLRFMHFLCKELRKNAKEKSGWDFERRIIPHKGSLWVSGMAGIRANFFIAFWTGQIDGILDRIQAILTCNHQTKSDNININIRGNKAQQYKCKYQTKNLFLCFSFNFVRYFHQFSTRLHFCCWLQF